MQLYFTNYYNCIQTLLTHNNNRQRIQAKHNLLKFVTMNLYKTITILAALLLLNISYGQSCARVLVEGKVVDTMQAQGFYNLMVVNKTSGRGVFGQPDGTFSVYASANDSIIFSVAGYSMYGFRVKADSNCQMHITGVLDHKAVKFDEVVIRPLKTLQQIKEERASLSMRETRLVTGIEVLNSPITALYQRFSKKEQSKQWVAEMEFKDDQRKVLKELLRVYIAYDIVNLDESEFDSFIAFLNMDEAFLQTSSDMELITFIKDKYEHFSRMNHHYFEEPPKKKGR